MPIKEKELVTHVETFIRINKYKVASWTDAQLKNEVDTYVATQISALDVENTAILKTALFIQALASRHLLNDGSSYSSSSSNTGDHFGIIFIPSYYYPYGFWWGPSCGCSSGDGEAALIFLCIIFGLSALAAAYGLGKDLFESIEELFNSQRISSNLATLAVAVALITATAIASMALFATNPVGWAFGAAASLVICTALIVKAVRYFANYLDAYLEQDSGLATDSRFYLTAREQKNLLEQGYTSDDIDKIKSMVRALAIKAKNLDVTGFFGTKDKYKQIINVLMDVKKGEIPLEMRTQYNLPKPPPKLQGGNPW